MAKETTTVDKDLYDGLQQARKKKPRYYAVIAKGPEVVGLIVQKKVISDGLVQKTKSECKGNLVIQGVCIGEGVELKFEVVGEIPTLLPKKLKDFIDEKTELALKPQWATVPQLTSVVDDDAPPAPPATAPAKAPTPAAAAAPVPPAPPPPPTAAAPKPPAASADAKGLQARLMALLVRQKAVVGKNAAVRDFLLATTKPTADLVTKGNAEAPAALDQLEQAIGGAELWSGEFARVEPQYLQVLGTNPPDATKIRGVMAYCTEQAAAGAYDKAVAGLKRVEPLLDAASGAAKSAAPGAAGDLTPIANRWRAAHAAVTAELEEFRQALLADEEIAGDPRFSFVQAASTEILNMLPPAAPVNAALKGGAAPAVLTAVQAYRKNLDAAAAFAKLESYTDDNLGFKLEVRQMLTAALDEMESSLAKA